MTELTPSGVFVRQYLWVKSNVEGGPSCKLLTGHY